MESQRANLFLIGAPKAATTFIYNCLSDSEDVFVPHLKEPHFFSVKYRDFPVTDMKGIEHQLQYTYSLSEYSKLYIKSDRRYNLDASVHYLYFKSVALDIKKYCPEAKIIIILRNPVLRAYSAFNYARMHGLEIFNKGFLDALREEQDKQDRNLDPILYYVGESLYHESVEYYLNQFADNILVLLYENIAANVQIELRKITDFLGVTEIQLSKKDNSAYNASRVPKNTFTNRILLNIGQYDWIKYLKTITPFSFTQKLRKTRNDFLEKRFEGGLSSHEYQTALEFFYDDIEKLQNLLSLDLSPWIDYHR